MSYDICLYLSEKPMASHSSTLSWEIPWMEEPGRLYSLWSRQESDTTEQLHFNFSLSCIGEGNGNPLQCFCLENPRDGVAWWAAVYGVTQSQTQLKWLSSSMIKIFKKVNISWASQTMLRTQIGNFSSTAHTYLVKFYYMQTISPVSSGWGME